MIDVSAVAVVDGATVVMGPPLHATASVGARARRGLELLPAEAVEHEQHDLVGRRPTTVGHPGRQRPSGRRPSSAGTMVMDAGAAVVGEHGLVAHDP